MAEIPVLKIGEILLVTIQNELNDRLVMALQENILRRIQQDHTPYVLIDVSSVELVDTYIGRVLLETALTAKLMDSETVIVGMQPAVAITMTEMGLNLPGIKTSISLEHGLKSLGYRLQKISDHDAPGDGGHQEIRT